jgi:predicted nuclease with TOPRIM domain
VLRRSEVIEKTLLERTEILEKYSKILESLKQRVSRVKLGLGILIEAIVSRFVYEDLKNVFVSSGGKLLFTLQ